MNKIPIVIEDTLFPAMGIFVLIPIDSPAWAHDVLAEVSGMPSTYQVVLDWTTFVGYEFRSREACESAGTLIRVREQHRFAQYVLTPGPNPDVDVHPQGEPA